jgi:hypothetical protein
MPEPITITSQVGAGVVVTGERWRVGATLGAG